MSGSVWDYHENSLIDALDCNDINAAQDHLDALTARFPNSLRVKKLRGLYLENATASNMKTPHTQTQPTKIGVSAVEYYNSLSASSEHSHDIQPRRRKIAMLISQNRTKEAITELCSFLEVWQSDYVSWLQLGLLHVELCDYRAALFCFEELLLIKPSNASNHLLVSEALLSTLDTFENDSVREEQKENLISARKYLSQSLVLRSGSLRGLLGLLLTTHQIENFKQKSVSTDLMNGELNKFAANKLKKICSMKDSPVNKNLINITEKVIAAYASKSA